MSREDVLRKLSVRLTHLAESSEPELNGLLDKLRQDLRQDSDGHQLKKISDMLAKKLIAREDQAATRSADNNGLGSAAKEFSASIKSLQVGSSYRAKLAGLADDLSNAGDLDRQLSLLKEIFGLLRVATASSPTSKSDAGRGWFGKKNAKTEALLQPFLDKTTELLGHILGHVEVVDGSSKDTGALAEKLATSSSMDAVESVLDSVIELLIRLGDKVSKERVTAQNFLGDLRERLHSVEETIFSMVGDGESSLKRAENLEREVNDDVQGIGEAVKEDDLTVLKEKVESGLENLSAKLMNYLETEKDHHQRSQVKIKNLTRKVREMEAEATNLRGEIKTKQDLAVKDPLTGIYNRAGYQERIVEEFSRRARVNAPLSLVFVDCNNFKEINDTFGHNAGDIVLVKVADILKCRARTSDILCRYGGDEFVVVLPDTAIDGAKVFAEAVCKKILEAGFNNNGQPLDVSISCGITEVQDSDNPPEALARADEAMYKAKQMDGLQVALG